MKTGGDVSSLLYTRKREAGRSSKTNYSPTRPHASPVGVSVRSVVRPGRCRGTPRFRGRLPPDQGRRSALPLPPPCARAEETSLSSPKPPPSSAPRTGQRGAFAMPPLDTPKAPKNFLYRRGCKHLQTKTKLHPQTFQVEKMVMQQENAPIVSEFTIKGLYGYRTISLQTSGPSTILIARNGSGKTTLLSALDALLRCQFGRLKGIEFSEISIEFGRSGRKLTVTQRDIEEISRQSDNSEFLALASELDISTEKLQFFIEKNAVNSAFDEIDRYEDPVLSKLFDISGYSQKAVEKRLEEILSAYFSSSPQLREFREIILTELSGVEVVYLPTYRRIEPPLRSKASTDAA
jgi:hypothetical protein